MILTIIVLVLGENSLPIKLRTVLYFLFSLIFSFVFAIRDLKSPDTAEYVSVFNRAVPSDGLFSKIDRFEWGYSALNRIIKIIGCNYQVLFFAVSIISFLLMFSVIKNYCNTKIGETDEKMNLPLSFLLVYIAYYGLLYNSIVMRGSLAIGLIYFSVVLVNKKKLILAIGLFALALSFHQTAILSLPIMFISFFNIKLSKKTGMKIIVIFLLLYIVGIGNISIKYMFDIIQFLYNKFPNVSLFWWSYLSLSGKNVATAGISFYRLFCFGILIILLKVDDGKKEMNQHILVSIIGIIILTLFGNLEIIIRLAEYYMISMCFAIYECGINISQSVRIRLLKDKVLIMRRQTFVVIVSCLFYYAFLRNVVFVK